MGCMGWDGGGGGGGGGTVYSGHLGYTNNATYQTKVNQTGQDPDPQQHPGMVKGPG